MTKSRFKKWFSKIQRYMFNYRDGFFEFPYISESPETMVASFDTMPFIKHFSKNQYMSCKNIFMDGEMHYRELEEGLWYIHGEVFYKKNVLYKRTYDPDQLSKYYFVGIEFLKNQSQTRASLANGMPYSNGSWLLYKPKVKDYNAYFKDTKAISCFVFFSEDWYRTNLLTDPVFLKSKFRDFFESDTGLLIWPNIDRNTEVLTENIRQKIEEEKTLDEVGVDVFKSYSIHLIHTFCKEYLKGEIPGDYDTIPDSTRNAIWKTERILRNGMYQQFMGIDELSKKVGISETHLKANFKKAFGTTIFQYFRNLQMEEAKVKLLDSDNSIVEVAKLFKYENPGKFSQAFKKYHGFLPSELEGRH